MVGLCGLVDAAQNRNETGFCEDGYEPSDSIEGREFERTLNSKNCYRT